MSSNVEDKKEVKDGIQAKYIKYKNNKFKKHKGSKETLDSNDGIKQHNNEIFLIICCRICVKT